MSGFSIKSLVTLLFVFTFVGHGFGQEQSPENKRVNFGYTKNPSSKVKKVVAENVSDKPIEAKPQISANNPNPADFKSRSAAQRTLDVAKRASLAALPPTEIYRVGINDVLFISLQNAPAKSSTYFTVLNDGSIDYPLGGGLISVNGLMLEEVEDLLNSKITLYENPQVAVKVREYASHSVTTLGLVEKSGQRFIQREAIPLFVIKAESVVKPEADEALIRRANSALEVVNLKKENSDEILILPGDIVEFRKSGANTIADGSARFYYIGGNIVAGGQKDFHQGLTLTQAILASGGLKKATTKTVLIRRKNDQGLLVTSQFNLRDIKNGKTPDPAIEAGDTIEIDD